MSSRNSDARAKAAALHREQQAAAKKRRIATITGGSVVAVLVVLALVLVATRGGGTANAAAAPPGLVDGAIQSGQAGAPVTLTLYEDLQCPACKAFEATNGATIDKLKQQGDIKVDLRPIAILDRNSTTNYSSRALNALACVQASAPSTTGAFVNAAFAQQPAENTAGLTDATLTSIAAKAGAPNVGSCVTDGTYSDWGKQSTKAGLAAGVNSTPTVLINGKPLAPENRTPEALTAAVQAAKK